MYERIGTTFRLQTSQDIATHHFYHWTKSGIIIRRSR
jgi:hypothetical protein